MSETFEKRLVGRPLKYETPDDLKKAINKYFEANEFLQYTVTGLALVIGSKQLLADYEQRDDYKEIVRQARLIVEHSYELALRNTTIPAGVIFALKNFGWSDRMEVDHSGGVEIITIVDDVPKKNPPKKE